MPVSEFLHLLYLVALLLVAVPIFASLHRMFSPRQRTLRAQFYPPYQWFVDLATNLSQAPPAKAKNSKPIFRRVTLFLYLFASVLILMSLPIFSDTYNNASVPSSILMAFLFILGFATLALGLSSTDALTRILVIEQFFARQALIVVICTSFFMLPYPWFAPITDVLHQQMALSSRLLVSYGVLHNPVAFGIAIIALAIYTRQWLENEVPLRTNIVASIESELPGPMFALFAISRNLEYFAIHALIVTMFLGGPYFDTPKTDLLQGVLFFGAKLVLTTLATLSVGYALPHYFRDRSYRIAFLWLVPFLFISGFVRTWLLS